MNFIPVIGTKFLSLELNANHSVQCLTEEQYFPHKNPISTLPWNWALPREQERKVLVQEQNAFEK